MEAEFRGVDFLRETSFEEGLDGCPNPSSSPTPL